MSLQAQIIALEGKKINLIQDVIDKVQDQGKSKEVENTILENIYKIDELGLSLKEKKDTLKFFAESNKYMEEASPFGEKIKSQLTDSEWIYVESKKLEIELVNFKLRDLRAS